MEWVGALLEFRRRNSDGKAEHGGAGTAEQSPAKPSAAEPSRRSVVKRSQAKLSRA